MNSKLMLLKVVVSGESAGGLSTFLHVDRVAAKLRSRAPNCKVVRGAPVVGFFLDHDNINNSKSNYTAKMKYIYSMQNLTTERNGGTISTSCVQAHSDSPHLCFMSPHMHGFIKTPYFVFNSKYDLWQIENEIQIRLNDPRSRKAVVAYGVDFLKQFASVTKESQNGGMITSCICHGEY